MAIARLALASGVLLIASACSSASTPATTSTDFTTKPDVAISNDGGSLEGHTPTAFPGTGTGLFAGDNLNASFPEGVGVHMYLTFALPSALSVGGARITSDALQVAGSPFEDLGPLLVEPVAYESFAPEVFDLPSIGSATECRVVDNTSIECDVTSAVQTAVDRGEDTAQFRIRFTRLADNDGKQDLAMFFRSDSNSNEAGLFMLTIEFGS
ncbi:MAG: hypothetical protein BMS9Abin12_1970 [Acidimicrobiia bacterium]|nr:MAG: hypothetical protein BMS9Abin12_1970 [Acidimicrobiia bacterium]